MYFLSFAPEQNEIQGRVPDLSSTHLWCIHKLNHHLLNRVDANTNIKGPLHGMIFFCVSIYFYIEEEAVVSYQSKHHDMELKRRNFLAVPCLLISFFVDKLRVEASFSPKFGSILLLMEIMWDACRCLLYCSWKSSPRLPLRVWACSHPCKSKHATSKGDLCYATPAICDCYWPASAYFGRRHKSWRSPSPQWKRTIVHNFSYVTDVAAFMAQFLPDITSFAQILNGPGDVMASRQISRKLTNPIRCQHMDLQNFLQDVSAILTDFTMCY